ncbi:MAG: bifunctional 4-hydroxy-3-methylbut-2-enyl diphosphate reductase/30S ribosomal protein S1 [Christensenellales bacterium]
MLVVAKHAGFCMGVRLAVNKALETAKLCVKEGLECRSLGNLINNPTAVEYLHSKGIKKIDRVEDAKGAVLIIRSHGVSRKILEQAGEIALRIVDCTCPFVERLHESVYEYSKYSKPVILIGDEKHPEIIGTAGWCQGEVYILDSAEEVKNLPDSLNNALVVAQTTFPPPVFEDILSRIKERFKNVEYRNTICAATVARQQEAFEIANWADCMIIVGGKNSANTRKLHETCLKYCPQSYLVESAAEIPPHLLVPRGAINIGITAGASTPEWTLKEVVDTMNDIKRNDQVQADQTEQAETANVTISDPHEHPAKPVLEEAVTQVSTTVQVTHINGDPHEETADNSPAQDAQEVPETPESAPSADNVADTPEASPNEEAAAPETEAPVTPKDLLKEAVDNFARIRQGQEVEGKIVQLTEDEVCVNIGYKSDGLMPRSELINPDAKVGDTIEVEIVKVNDGEGNVIVSQRNIVRKYKWEEICKKFDSGEIVEAVVQRAVKGGLLCNIESFRTFIPASHVARNFVSDLTPFVGKIVKVKLLELEQRKRHIVASRKQALIEEREKAKEAAWAKLEEGAVVKGIVRRFAKFGAFVDLGGVDGLIHISDISWVRGVKPEEVLTINSEIDVLIMSLDKERERIQLGYKQLHPKPWDNAEEKYPVGAIFNREVVRLCSFGAFIELEPGVDGLCHISQISTQRVEDIESALTPGQMVDVKILSVDPHAKRISLSIREAMEDTVFDNDFDSDIPSLDIPEEEPVYESSMATAFKEALEEKSALDAATEKSEAEEEVPETEAEAEEAEEETEETLEVEEVPEESDEDDVPVSEEEDDEVVVSEETDETSEEAEEDEEVAKKAEEKSEE